MDSSKSRIPENYIWPQKDLDVPAEEELQEPVIDLQGFLKGEKEATFEASEVVRRSCLNHGCFQVINHGVDAEVIRLAHQHARAFFKLPVIEKQKGQHRPGCPWGFSLAHTSRFSSKLPWKEMLTFGFRHIGDDDDAVVQFFLSQFGEEFEATGLVFQQYCVAMKQLALALLEILGISLGVDRAYFKEFYEDGNAIMRANFYPTCPQPGLTMGVGPHFDPTSMTILHQNEVKGLEVFVDNKWKSVRPRSDAFVISVGDTLMAMSNGMYKSCLHRAVVNKYQERISLTYFLCPKEDKMVKPPEDLISRERPRKYPEFTWLDFLCYTTNHYRADEATFQNFINWLSSSKPPTTP